MRPRHARGAKSAAIFCWWQKTLTNGRDSYFAGICRQRNCVPATIFATTLSAKGGVKSGPKYQRLCMQKTKRRKRERASSDLVRSSFFYRIYTRQTPKKINIKLMDDRSLI